MTPLVDVHCHLLAGLDDGPASLEEAITMCRVAWDDGVRAVAATAHLSERWPEVTADRIRSATQQLVARLREIRLPLTIYPSAEVEVSPDLEEAWSGQRLFGVADGQAYVLIEFPHGMSFDLRDTVRGLRAHGVRPILAHPERQEELLYAPGMIEALIRLGCLVQVNANSLAGPAPEEVKHVLRRWVQRGVVHLIGSDGHSVERRPPRMSAAYERIASWTDSSVADRLCCLHGLAVLEGRRLRLPEPERVRRHWFSFLRR